MTENPHNKELRTQYAEVKLHVANDNHNACPVEIRIKHHVLIEIHPAIIAALVAFCLVVILFMAIIASSK